MAYEDEVELLEPPIDADFEEQQPPIAQPLARTVPATVVPAPKAVQTTALTPADARNNAIAEALHSAYAKASLLTLTKEESTALTRIFDDPDYRRGAGGDDKLVYLGHASCRTRINEVFGIGQWALICRNYRTEDYQSKSGTATRVYADCVLLVRGCYVGEAIGCMSYFPNNAKSNYSDAAEGAQSEALRRIAGKYLGVGLECWKPAWVAKWEERNPPKAPYATSQTQTRPQAQQTQAAPPPARRPRSLDDQDNQMPQIGDGLKLEGILKATSQPKATKKPNCFKYGILVEGELGGTWLNTFDRKFDDFGKANKGVNVIVEYTEGQYGKTVVAIACA